MKVSVARRPTTAGLQETLALLVANISRQAAGMLGAALGTARPTVVGLHATDTFIDEDLDDQLAFYDVVKRRVKKRRPCGRR